jgi:hypothetical protein
MCLKAASVGGLFRSIIPSHHPDLAHTEMVADIGLTDHAWSIGELLDATLAVATPDPTETAPDRRRKFRVIGGGRL